MVKDMVLVRAAVVWDIRQLIGEALAGAQFTWISRKNELSHVATTKAVRGLLPASWVASPLCFSYRASCFVSPFGHSFGDKKEKFASPIICSRKLLVISRYAFHVSL